MTKNLLLTSLTLALLILAGCKQDADTTKLSPFLYDYTPVDVGHSVTYDVDSIIYNFILGDTQQIDTIHFQLKQLVHDTFYDALGRVNYTIYNYKRYDTTQPFLLVDREWFWVQTRNTFETWEDDLHFVKFTFPPALNNYWPGNEYLPASDTIADVYQPFAGWTYKFTAVNVPNTYNGVRYDSTTTVTEDSSQNLINDEIEIETYARHVGLVYKQWELLDKQSIGSSWAAPDSVNGFRIRWTVHTYTP